MKIAKIIGFISLAGTIIPPALFMLHILKSEVVMQQIMFVSCIGWFVTAPLWMKAE